jgi:hypothetical protein
MDKLNKFDKFEQLFFVFTVRIMIGRLVEVDNTNTNYQYDKMSMFTHTSFEFIY